MRMSVLAVAAIAAGGMGFATATTSAVAQNYPICMHWKYDSVLCHYESMAQCMASASGIGGDCIQNPAYAGYYQPAPPDRIVQRPYHHRYRHHTY